MKPTLKPTSANALTQEAIRVRQTIYGNCPSKSNCYQVVRKGMIKSEALKKYENSFFIQCNHYRNVNIIGYFEIELSVFYPSERSDLDNSLKVVLDCLQNVKAIANDNKCVKITAHKFIDKKNPRIEFQLTEL